MIDLKNTDEDSASKIDRRPKKEKIVLDNSINKIIKINVMIILIIIFFAIIFVIIFLILKERNKKIINEIPKNLIYCLRNNNMNEKRTD